MSFLIAFNNYDPVVQLTIVYLVSFLFAYLNFLRRQSFKVLIDKNSKSITLPKSKTVSLSNRKLKIALSSWLLDNILSYGLYLVDSEGKKKLLYGYSTYSDIDQLYNKLHDEINVG
jgi:hypothetical protein